jgi:hypothetical protein
LSSSRCTASNPSACSSCSSRSLGAGDVDCMCTKDGRRVCCGSGLGVNTPGIGDMTINEIIAARNTCDKNTSNGFRFCNVCKNNDANCVQTSGCDSSGNVIFPSGYYQ